MVLIRAFLVWLVIITVETVHGILRGVLLVPIVGDLPARQIGVLIGSLLIFAVAYLFIRWIAVKTKLQFLAVGLLWVLLTVIFEVVLGRLVLGLSWTRITEDYDLSQGGLLGLGLLFMAAAPCCRLVCEHCGRGVGAYQSRAWFEPHSDRFEFLPARVRRGVGVLQGSLASQRRRVPLPGPLARPE